VRPRAGRREHPRRGFAQRSRFERYRSVMLTAAGVVALLLVGGFVFFSATAKSYTCGTLWEPAPTASPAPGSTQALGYVQPDMGHTHNVSQPQNYTFCPPASGKHISAANLGPIPARVYGPDDDAQPPGWVHNLEHGGLVVLYRCPGAACEDEGQGQLRAFWQSFPNSPICHLPRGQIGPVVARFDDMKWPYAAIVWDRVLPLESFDGAKIIQFFNQFGERTNSEKQCQAPTPTPAPSGSPSGSPAASPSASGAASPTPTSS
jgi:hypothetical protein